MQFEFSLVSLCSFSGFSPAQQTWFSALSGKLGAFKMQKGGFLDPYILFSIF